jgi:hypothetical protein
MHGYSSCDLDLLQLLLVLLLQSLCMVQVMLNEIKPHASANHSENSTAWAFIGA